MYVYKKVSMFSMKMNENISNDFYKEGKKEMLFGMNTHCAFLLMLVFFLLPDYILYENVYLEMRFLTLRMYNNEIKKIFYFFY